jgi:hypothetical protein
VGINVPRHHRMFPSFDGFDLAMLAIGIAMVLAIALVERFQS